MDFLKKSVSTVIAEKKILLILGHAITLYYSQGSTLAYMKGDLSIHQQENCNSEKLPTTYILG